MDRAVYLPDFPVINQQFAEREVRSGVVHEGILREFADLRRDGIRSLREFLVGRGEVTPINPNGHAEQRQQEAIRYVQIAASGRRLISELSRIGVGQSRLKPDFLSVMAQLSTVRRAEKIIVRYRVGAAVYETDAKAGLDKNYTLWVADDASDIAPFEALAERLFRAGEDVDTAPYKLFKAVEAVRASYGRLIVVPPPATDEVLNKSDTTMETIDRPSDVLGQDSTDGGGAPAIGHAAPKFDAPPVPNPTRFPTARPQDFVESGYKPITDGSRSRRTPARGSTSERRNTVLEDFEKMQLKRDNYAYHCQACVGLHQPGSLTPKFTYVWDKDYRNRNIEAHHVEHLQNDGELGAGNLVILCQYHHDFLGDKLGRDEITRGLQAANQMTRRFPADTDGVEKKSIVGYIVKIQLDMPPHEVPLFFTVEHASVWLDRASGLRNEKGGLDDAAG
jgi:hypothetical protein